MQKTDGTFSPLPVIPPLITACLSLIISPTWKTPAAPRKESGCYVDKSTKQRSLPCVNTYYMYIRGYVFIVVFRATSPLTA